MPFENAPVLSRGFVCGTRKLAMTRVMTSLLYEVAPTDPATFAASRPPCRSIPRFPVSRTRPIWRRAAGPPLKAARVDPPLLNVQFDLLLARAAEWRRCQRQGTRSDWPTRP
jgi:hypothetical protein